MRQSGPGAEPGGELESADVVLARFGRPLLRYLGYLARDPQLAEALARDTLLRVFGPGDAELAAFPPAARVWIAATRLWLARGAEDAAAERERAARWLAGVEGLAEPEIAAALGVSASSLAPFLERVRGDAAAREALRALPEPELPVALTRSVTLGLARAARSPSAARGEALPTIRLTGSRRRLALVAAAAASLALALALFARLPRPAPPAPEPAPRSAQQPAPPAPAAEPAPPSAAKPATPPAPRPEDLAPPTPDPASVRPDAPTLEDFAVIEVLDVLDALGDVGGGRG